MYEYKIMAADVPEASEEQLNRYGQEGWMLVQIMEVPDKGWHYWFVRRVSEDNK